MEHWTNDGILTLEGSGRQFVIDCVSGNLIPRSQARWIGWSKKYGGPFWIAENSDINDALGMLYQSKPKEEKLKEVEA